MHTRNQFSVTNRPGMLQKGTTNSLWKRMNADESEPIDLSSGAKPIDVMGMGLVTQTELGKIMTNSIS